jgi:hypothetical protein
MPYSPVTQPLPLPRIQIGTRSSTLAVHSTRVSPNSASTLPSACRVKSGIKLTLRISFAWRPLGRIVALRFLLNYVPSHRRAVPVVLSL